MPDRTRNHGLNLYEQGETDWTHTPDMETIEERLVVRDLEENVNSYVPHPKATFVAEDTGAVYDSDPENGQWVDASRGYGAVRTAELNAVPQVRVRATSGSGTKADPFDVPVDVLEDYQGLVQFGRGWFETDGMATGADDEYDETSVYLVGDGIRTTTLQHAADAPSEPTVHFRGAGGNFGGIHDMTVYGGGEGEMGAGSAPIVQSDGEIIDLQFRNVIVRYGGGDVLRLESSSSGTRVQNAWLENAPGWALYIGGGSRIKVNGVHTAGTHGGIHTEGTIGNFSDITITSAWGYNGIETVSSGNNFSNVVLQSDLDRGFRIHGSDTTVSNVLVQDANREAFYVAASSAISNAIVTDAGADGSAVLRLLADGTTVSNVWARRTDTEYTTRLLELDANRCRIDGLGGDPSEEWELVVQPGATENVVDGLVGVSYANIDDGGTRTLLNGWGTNGGDPRVEGEWNGHADYAGRMGATVWDTSTEPWTPYDVSPDGSWIS